MLRPFRIVLSRLSVACAVLAGHGFRAADADAAGAPGAAGAGSAPEFRLERFEPGKPGRKPEPFDTALFETLEAYTQVRSAGFAGWADSGLYIGTRLGRYPQLHQVSRPGGYRRQLTFFSRRMAGFYLNPDPGRRNFVYSFDAGGDERFQLRLFDLALGAGRELGMPPGRADGLIWNDSGTAFAYAHVPEGTDRWDIRLGRPDGFDTLLLSLPGTWFPMDIRPDGKSILVQRYVSAAEAELYALDVPGGTLTLLTTGGPPASVDDAAFIRTAAFDVLYTSDRDGEAHRLYRLTAEAMRAGPVEPGRGTPSLARIIGKPVPVSAPGPWDVEWIAVSPDGGTLAYSVNEEGYSRVYVLPPGASEARLLAGAPRGLIGKAAFRPGRNPTEFAATVSGPTLPGDVFVCDWTRDRWTRWTFSEAGGLPEGSFRPAEPLRYPNPDIRPAPSGTDPGPRTSPEVPARRNPPGNSVARAVAEPGTVPAFLVRPDSARFPGPRPVVIQIHGGPEMQARPGFDAYVQYLASVLGYAVVLPNVRGSSGYGKSWLAADDGYDRMNAVRDIGALLDWIGTRPGLDSGRVAVSGRSYGGFMSLASLVEYGPRLKAGISAVGISHFPTFLKRTSGYRRDLRRAEYGDERDPRMAAFLDSISPLTRAGRIRTPLLLIHGRNDPRVPYGESARIFAALKARKVPVWFLTFEAEGHAARDEDAVRTQWRTQTEFLARRLGVPPFSGSR